MLCTVVSDNRFIFIFIYFPVADPGFAVGGCEPVRGHGPLTQFLFGENVCENERIGSRRGGMRQARLLDPPMFPENPMECCPDYRQIS